MTSDRSVSRILSGRAGRFTSEDFIPAILPGRSSLWTARLRTVQAAYPGLAPEKPGALLWRRAASRRPQTASSLLGLAPGGGYLATRIAADAGGLLHHLFTITVLPPSPKPNGFERELWAGTGCLFLWPCSGRFAPFGAPRPGCYPTSCSTECGLSSTLMNKVAIAQPT
jgi:hypothetical protein